MTPEHSGPALVLDGVTRRFGDIAAVEEVTATVDSGQLFGLVGPSGCGKTTLVRLIAGLLNADEGTILVRGARPEAFGAAERQQIGYLPQEFSLFPSLSVQANCRFVAGLYGIGWFGRRRRIREVLEFLELWDARKRRAAQISGGMKRRLSLACAILHRPSVLLVDEPTAGLDPTLRARIWDYLRDLQAEGTTVVITTQYIEEAERCDSVGVMREGRLFARGRPDELRQQADLPEVVDLHVEDLHQADLPALWGVDGVREIRRSAGGRLLVTADDAQAALPRLTEVLVAQGRHLRSAEAREASFEEVFLALVDRDQARGAAGGTAEQGGTARRGAA